MKNHNSLLAILMLLLLSSMPFAHADELGTGKTDDEAPATMTPAPEENETESSETRCLWKILASWFK